MKDLLVTTWRLVTVTIIKKLCRDCSPYKSRDVIKRLVFSLVAII